ncbi:MAG: hypothetical protein EOO74_06005 [Myxococcales bacterium]|nr:MAG: hypothetical protein EOO74_06005 [Myxococcales bacterium]
MGIELGQLAVVAVVAVAWRLLSARAAAVADGARTAALYAAGSLGAFWTIERVAALVAGAP